MPMLSSAEGRRNISQSAARANCGMRVSNLVLTSTVRTRLGSTWRGGAVGEVYRVRPDEGGRLRGIVRHHAGGQGPRCHAHGYLVASV